MDGSVIPITICAIPLSLLACSMIVLMSRGASTAVVRLQATSTLLAVLSLVTMLTGCQIVTGLPPFYQGTFFIPVHEQLEINWLHIVITLSLGLSVLCAAVALVKYTPSPDLSSVLGCTKHFDPSQHSNLIAVKQQTKTAPLALTCAGLIAAIAVYGLGLDIDIALSKAFSTVIPYAGNAGRIPRRTPVLK